jgi:hypothetical protein
MLESGLVVFCSVQSMAVSEAEAWKNIVLLLNSLKMLH